MELGSWSLISAPSLLALIPLVVMIVLIFIGKSNVSGIMRFWWSYLCFFLF